MSERAPEDPQQPFEAPEGVLPTEPEGDGAPAPEADLGGQEIPEDLSGLPDDEEDEYDEQEQDAPEEPDEGDVP